MKKYFLLLLISCFCFADMHAQVFKKKDFHISAGYGIGNVWKIYLKDAFSFPEYYSVRSTGPFCLLADYALFNKISVGIAAGYSETRGRASYNGFEFKERLNAFSLLARANFHPFHLKNFDPYAGVGIGYYHFRYINELDETAAHKVPGNLGYSLQLGGRYYFSPRFAVYAELGYIGGSLAQAGLTIKF